MWIKFVVYFQQCQYENTTSFLIIDSMDLLHFEKKNEKCHGFIAV